MSDNPYDILGIPKTATFAEARARYFQLARKHHPDKLHHLSEEERKKNEEFFQKISAAYSRIEKGEDANTTSHQKADHWRTIWSKVEGVFQRPEIWECMLHVLKGTFDDAPKDTALTLGHTIRVPVTLQDLHLGKRKKLQLFLHGIEQPVHTQLQCKNFPKEHEFTTCIEGKNHSISVGYNIIPHEIFRLDDILGTQDLYVDIDITWYDYVFGSHKEITYLDGTLIHVPFHPFDRVDYPVRIEGKGLAGKGDLYVSHHIRHPTHEQWCQLSSQQQKDFMNILNALLHIRSGVQK
jgi:hypothetical protein